MKKKLIEREDFEKFENEREKCPNRVDKILYHGTNIKSELYGLLKLCLLKEISSKLNDWQINNLPDIISYIMQILKNGYFDSPDMKKCIKDVLDKMKGSNIISFSKYVNEIITANELNNIIALLKKDELNEINDIKNRLSKYNE